MTLRYNEHMLKQLRMEQNHDEYKARTSRLAKWKELAVAAQQDLEVHMDFPDKLV